MRKLINIDEVRKGDRISVAGCKDEWFNNKWIIRFVSPATETKPAYISGKHSPRPGRQGRKGWGTHFDSFEGATIRLLSREGVQNE